MPTRACILVKIYYNEYQGFQISIESGWLDTVKQQVITCTNVDQDLCQRVASLSHNAMNAFDWKDAMIATAHIKNP